MALPEADWLWCAEVEDFPRQVLAARFPHSTQLGDVLADDFLDRAKAFGRLDVLCGGPPCQAFSVAGLRGGMKDPRGQLSIRFVEIAHELASTVGLGNLLVENVPGWLNHPDNAFGCFLGAIVGGDEALHSPLDGKWPDVGMVAGPRARAAWRVFDAQYLGLAQRRQRVFVVVDFGTGADPAAVLFERDCGVGNPSSRRQTGQSVAGTLSARTEGGGGLGTDFDLAGGLVPKEGLYCHDVAPTIDTTLADKQGLDDQHVNGGGAGSLPAVALCLNAGAMQRQDPTFETLIPVNRCVFDDVVAHTLRGEGFDASEDGTGRGTPLVPIAYRTSGNCGAWETGDTTDALTTGTDPNSHVIAFTSKDYGNDATADVSPTLRSMGHADSYANGGGQVAIAMQAGMVRENPNSGPDGKGWQPDIAYTLEARAEVQAVAFDTTQLTSPANYSNPQPGDPCHPLAAAAHVPAVAYDMRGRDGGAQMEGPHDTANLRAASGGSSRSYVQTEWAVRRLTPAECEILQGYPVGHTLIETNKRRTVEADEAEYLRHHGAIVTLGNDGKLRTNAAADGPRYKALGNAWAVPCAAWILRRIGMALTATRPTDAAVTGGSTNRAGGFPHMKD